MATVRSRRVSVARYTSPIPPAPMSTVISYGPKRVPAVRAIGCAVPLRRSFALFAELYLTWWGIGIGLALGPELVAFRLP